MRSARVKHFAGLAGDAEVRQLFWTMKGFGNQPDLSEPRLSHQRISFSMTEGPSRSETRGLGRHRAFRKRSRREALDSGGSGDYQDYLLTTVFYTCWVTTRFPRKGEGNACGNGAELFYL